MDLTILLRAFWQKALKHYNVDPERLEVNVYLNEKRVSVVVKGLIVDSMDIPQIQFNLLYVYLRKRVKEHYAILQLLIITHKNIELYYVSGKQKLKLILE